MAIKVAV